jgi:hypothetical protein
MMEGERGFKGSWMQWTKQGENGGFRYPMQPESPDKSSISTASFNSCKLVSYGSSLCKWYKMVAVYKVVGPKVKAVLSD